MSVCPSLTGDGPTNERGAKDFDEDIEVQFIIYEEAAKAYGVKKTPT